MKTCLRLILAIAIISSVAAAHAQSGAQTAKTPRLDGRPDLNGTWDTGYNDIAIGFVQPQQLAGGSLCVSGCAPAAGAARGPSTGSGPSRAESRDGAAAGRTGGAPAAPSRPPTSTESPVP